MNMESSFSPREIVSELDKFIIGQTNAKKAVAVALRNRWRRKQLPDSLKEEILPKNILMVGPTGCGKTEISRRLAKLANAPFIKIEATKFTEVGYVGRDVESIVRDLVDVAAKLIREEAIEEVQTKAAEAAEEQVLAVLLPAPKNTDPHFKQPDNQSTKESFRNKLRSGDLDEDYIEIDISHAAIGVEIMTPPGMEEMTNQLQSMLQNLSSDKSRKRKLKIKDALKILQEDESAKLVNDEEIKANAIERVEQHGIVFLDEIDKVTQRSDRHGAGDVSREGVQRDLLPLIEGCTVSTRYGMVKTDHILFIASGAFHLSKPSDLIPELQGRLPIRVGLDSLSTKDFIRILTEPDASLTEQYIALLATEGVTINFDAKGIERIADIAWGVNERTENIGARRLHTVLERLLEELSFEATEIAPDTITITADYVDKQLEELSKDEDLSRFIL